MDQALTQNDDYVFPDNQLLLKTNPKNLKTVKSIFKTADVMSLRFTHEQLSFMNPTSEQRDQSAYEIAAQSLQEGQGCQFATYIAKDQDQLAANFQVQLCYRHL